MYILSKPLFSKKVWKSIVIYQQKSGNSELDFFEFMLFSTKRRMVILPKGEEPGFRFPACYSLTSQLSSQGKSEWSFSP